MNLGLEMNKKSQKRCESRPTRCGESDACADVSGILVASMCR